MFHLLFLAFISGSCLQQLLLWQWWCSKGNLLFQEGSFKMMVLTSFVYWFVNFPELVKPAGCTLHPACPLYVLNEPLYNWAELSRFYWRMINLASGLTGSGFTQCGPTGCMSVTWELFEIRISKPHSRSSSGGSSNLGFSKPSRWFQSPRKFESHWSRGAFNQ